MVYGTLDGLQRDQPGDRRSTSAGRWRRIPFTHTQVYIALTAFVINLIVAVVLTVLFRALKVPDGVDSTHHTDYVADKGDPGVQDLPEFLDEGGAATAKS